MLKSQPVTIAEIYVPARFAGTLDADKVAALAESILEEGLKVPIQVRRGTGRFVLVTGLHRLEAMKALGEATIDALVVQARRH